MVYRPKSKLQEGQAGQCWASAGPHMLLVQETHLQLISERHHDK